MAIYASAAPVRPGTVQAWKNAVREMKTTRRTEHEASRRRLGLSREDVWFQPTPMGDFAIVYMEAPDVGKVLQEFMTSNEPYDRWFRETILMGVHGVDPKVPPPPMNERIL